MEKRIDLPRGNYITIVVEQDTDAQDPREMDMAAFHIADSRHQFEAILEETDITSHGTHAVVNGEVIQTGNGKIYMGLEKYSHGQDVYALCQQGNFPDRRWDVSPLVGFITPHPDVDSDVIAKFHGLVAEGKPEEAKAVLSKRLNQDISTFNQWLLGEVYGYTTTLYDTDGTELGDESCWGFYGEDYCEKEAVYSAHSLALSVLTELELIIYLGHAIDNEISKYVKAWYLQIFAGKDSDLDWDVKTVAKKAYDYITKAYLKDAPPELLIARVKSDVHDDYPEHPQEDWRMEAANGDTILGYWEWVNHRVMECQDNS